MATDRWQDGASRGNAAANFTTSILGDPLAPTNVATPKYQIWVSLFPGGNFLAKFSYKFLHRWSCTQTAQIALEYYSHTMGVWKSIY